VNTSVFITVVLAVIAGNVAMMGNLVKVLSDRIGDLVSRVDRADTRADERHTLYMAKFDGIAETLARFDRRFEDGH